MFTSLTLPEKTAWVMGLILAFAGWFYMAPIVSSVAQGLATPLAGPSAIGFVLIVVVLSIVGHIIVAITDPKTANQRADERDRSNAHWAGHWSGLAFGFLTITSLLYFIVSRDGDLLFHTVFGGMIVSQILEYMLIVIAYRRGS